MKKIFTLFATMVCVMSMNALTYNVTVPAGTNACYIAGEMNGWSHTEMSKVDATHYTLDIDGATASMKYKYCSGPGWAYVEKTASSGEVADRTYSANDVVAKWASVYDPNAIIEGTKKDITARAKVPAHWTGTITAWVWETGKEGKEITPTKDGDWYAYTANCVELNIIFKNGKGWTGDANQTIDIALTESTCMQINQTGSSKATYTVVDCESGEEKPTLPVVSLAGSMNDWSTLSNPFVAASDSLTASATMTLDVDTYEFKIVVDGSWLGNTGTITRDNCTDWKFEVLDGAETNAHITTDIAGAYTFIWTYATNQLSVKYPTLSGVQNIKTANKASKIIRDGYMYIIRDGVMYNIFGQTVTL